MRRKNVGALAVLCLLCAGLLRADGSNTEVVTNKPDAAKATMTGVTDPTTGCITYTATGKVSPHYRSEGGTSVVLECTLFCFLSGTACPPGLRPIIRFPTCPTDTGTDISVNSCSSAPVDSCGNFSFQAATVCPSDSGFPHLDPEYSCVFVVHTDLTKGAPQSCSSAGNTNGILPTDPNGSAPCSGGACPISP